ncbi:MAG: hypothetical protein JNM06_03080 [Blastocatellia bacterium]|nr:hypothetical protein [Blastocatellia bacterium]MBN8725377.1 hypothetical protein [Acidobacteriota bacterium]
MTNKEIQKLIEFIITQQAEMSVKHAQILDIQFETAKRQGEYEKRQAEFEIKFNNKLDALLDWQAKFSIDLEDLRKETKEFRDDLKKTKDTLKETNDILKQVSHLAVETSERVDKLEDKLEDNEKE